MLNLLNESIFDNPCDLLIIPFSTGGTISPSFSEELEKNNIIFTLQNTKYELGKLVIQPIVGHETLKYIAFACTVDRNHSNYAAIRQIGLDLGKEVQNLKNIRKINSPVLGTGAGNLDYYDSLNVLRTAFYEIAPNVVSLNFSVIDGDQYRYLKSQVFDIDTPSSRLAFAASIREIRKHKIFEKIRYEKGHYFQLAKDKFEEFRQFQPYELSFFSRLLDKFRSSQLSFSEFLALPDKSREESDFLLLCGELIAYIDHKAYFKNLWNKYEDKRVLAHSNVWPNHWLTNLLKYKLQGIGGVTAKSVRNALIYLSDPEHNIIMLSENHRTAVFSRLILKPYENDLSIRYVFELFRSFEINCINPLNDGALYTFILYSPEIKQLWSTDLKGGERLFSDHRSNGYNSFASELIWNNLKSKTKTLDLGNCGLKNLDQLPELFECSHLETLILSNEWAEFENGMWHERTSQNSGPQNLLTSLPDELYRLHNLKRFICGGDWRDGEKWNRWGIRSIAILSRLSQLEYLNLSNNNLKNLDGISRLRKLRVLHANNNHISTIHGLPAELEEIYLSNNKISNIDFLPKEKNKIHTIDLHANKIKNLTNLEGLISELGISNTKWELKTINIAKNPLEEPPMTFIEQGKEAVLRYFKDISSGNYINKEIKIILVGNSGVGKTTLAKYLDDEKELHIQHSPTHWMEEREVLSKQIIDKIKGKCLIRLFDFGGHDYFHDTHHLFFSQNTIYILLWDEATNHLNLRELSSEQEDYIDQTQDYPIKYWLESVKYFIKDTVEATNIEFETSAEETYNGSLIIVQNKAESTHKTVHLNNCDIAHKYPFVSEFLHVDILSKRNMNYFDTILTELLNSTEIIGQVLPDFYQPISEDIKKYSGKPILTFDEFRIYCNNLNEKTIDEDQTTDLAEHFKKVGMIIYTGNSKPDKIYIDKKWVVRNIYETLKGLKEKKGVFDVEHVIKSTKLDKDQVLSLIDMMLGLKIIVKHPYDSKYIAPLYLPLMPNEKVNLFLNDNKIPYRRLEYTGFIHKSIILDFFHEYGNRIIKESLDTGSSTYYYWKDALIVKDTISDSIVMIKFIIGTNEGNSYVDIFSLRNSETPFVNDVLNSLKEISEKYDFEEMVTINGSDFISLDILTDNAKMSKLVFVERRKSDLDNLPEKNEKLFHLKDFEQFLPHGIRKKKVVISYSKKDLALVHNLVRYLRPLMARDLIEEPWYCTLQNPALEWDSKIQHKFKEADIVFFMISEYFYSTEYIIEKEIKTTISRYNTDKNVKIVPIILEHYDWSRPGEWDLTRFSALPYQAKPISDFGNPKIAWHTITASIKMMIEKDLDPLKSDLISRELQEIYERQVHGKLDRNF